MKTALRVRGARRGPPTRGRLKQGLAVDRVPSSDPLAAWASCAPSACAHATCRHAEKHLHGACNCTGHSERSADHSTLPVTIHCALPEARVDPIFEEAADMGEIAEIVADQILKSGGILRYWGDKNHSRAMPREQARQVRIENNMRSWARRREAGLCAECGEKADGSTRCAAHREENRVRSRERYQKKKQASHA